MEINFICITLDNVIFTLRIIPTDTQMPIWVSVGMIES